MRLLLPQRISDSFSGEARVLRSGQAWPGLS